MNPKDQIKETLSIVDVVSTYIRLEKSGSQFRARCPFHNEKTPSFYVSPERRSFHCFGCQQHGDIFTFVEKIENIPFYDALKILADRAGISLKDTEKNKEDSRLISLLHDATSHFEKNITTSPEAKQYLMERGLAEETITTFHVGYAKNEWRDLFMFLVSRGYTPEEIESSGVAIQALDTNGKVKGWYDRFRGRIMFPIRNISGATVGYSGRIMPSLVDPTVAQGKYVNTPETTLYHKSKILFGYDTAKKKMNETKEVVVVEGQMDLCMSYQAGIHNTVAVSGTAFTDEHIHLIRRFCDKVILSFDTDTAGQNALKKTALLCLLGGLDVYVVGDIGTKDPADLIKENKDAWIHAVKNKRHVIEVMLQSTMDAHTDLRVRNQKIVNDVLPYVRAITSPVDRSHFLHMIAQKSGIMETVLIEELMRGAAHMEEIAIEETPSIPRKERVVRQMIAYSMLVPGDARAHIEKLSIDTTVFPEAILEQEVFMLEKKLTKDAKENDLFFTDLLTTYNGILRQEKVDIIMQRMKSGEGDQDILMRELHELMKENKR